MAKKSGHGGNREGAGRPKTERDDGVIKMSRKLIAKIHVITQSRGGSAAEYLDGFAKQIDKDFEKAIEDLRRKNN